MEITTMSVTALRKALDRREISAVELATAYLDRIGKVDPSFSAFITVPRETVLQMAAAADRIIASGEGIKPLTGIPVAVKDNICTAGIRTTCASRLLQDFVPIYNATVVTKLEQAGAVLLGKTNLDEFAMGSATLDSAFGVTPNPWDRMRVAGGSSGGSAVAVATGMAPLALGTDTGGSIRQPAAFCGVWGLKPTYGRVSRYGLIPYAPSLDQIGPFAKNGGDLLLLLRCLAGYEPFDPTSLPDEAGRRERVGQRLRIGLPRQFFGEGLDPDLKERVLSVAYHLEQDGCELVEISLPSVEYAVPAYYLIAYAEASSSLARYDGVRYGQRAGVTEGVSAMMKATRGGFGPEVKRRLLLGTYFLSEVCYEDYYIRAQKVRTWIKQEITAAFTRCDLLLTPTTATPAFKIKEKDIDELSSLLTEQYTVVANLTGIPALSFPCGFVGHLPVGAQLMASPGGDELLCEVAVRYGEMAQEKVVTSGQAPKAGEENRL